MFTLQVAGWVPSPLERAEGEAFEAKSSRKRSSIQSLFSKEITG
jgi:hypothetical protein